jgi:hypothetical protein
MASYRHCTPSRNRTKSFFSSCDVFAESVGKKLSQYLSSMTRPLFFALLGLSGCVRQATQPPLSATNQAGFIRFYGPRADALRADSNVVVFPFHPDDTLAFFPRLAGPLASAVLSSIEAMITDSLVKEVEAAHQVAHYGHRYQYLPAVDSRGAKHMWVNAFCRSDASWTSAVVAYKGGGACFYSVQLNLTTRRYTAFHTNAPK